jgi:hypothetical protein
MTSVQIQSSGLPALAGSAEEKWMIACLSSRYDPQALTKAKQISDAPGFNWPVCLESIHRENIAPLLYGVLVGKNLVSAEIEQALAHAYTRNQSRNILRLNDLKTVLQRLFSENIDLILLKGASLLFDIYPDAANRPMGDFDVLISKDQLARGLACLKKIGYVLEKEPRSQWSLGFENEILLVKEGPLNTYLEIHWNLIDSPFYQDRISTDWFWQTTRQAQIVNLPCKVLGVEAQILHLCAHLALHHGGRGVLWLNDLAMLITRYQHGIDWDSLLFHAQDNQLLIPTRDTLETLITEWNVPIPDVFIGQINRLHPSPEEKMVNSRLVNKNRHVTTRFLDDLRSIPTWRLRLLFTLDNLFPSPVYMRTRYQISHPVLLPYYYLVRWIRGLRNAI